MQVALLVNINGESIRAAAQVLTGTRHAIVFATGYDNSKVPAAFRTAPSLQKLFTRRDMERALRGALNS